MTLVCRVQLVTLVASYLAACFAGYNISARHSSSERNQISLSLTQSLAMATFHSCTSGQTAHTALNDRPTVQPPLCRPARRRMLVLAASSERSGQAAMTLRDACRSKRVPPEEVLAALRQVEAANQQQAMVQGGLVCASGNKDNWSWLPAAM